MIERSRVRIPAGSTFYFGIRSTPVLPQWHVKDPGLSGKSAVVVVVELMLNVLRCHLTY